MRAFQAAELNLECFMKNDNQCLNLRTEEQNSLLWPCHNRGRNVECEELYIQTCFEALTALTNWPRLHKIKSRHE